MKQVRLFDRLRALATLPDDKALLGQAQVIEATNVSDYFYQVNDREYWAFVEDFPNVAPPFPVSFVEFEAPKFILSEEFGKTPWHSWRPSRWGLLILANRLEPGPWDADDPTYRAVHEKLIFDAESTKTTALPERPSWLMNVQFFAEFERVPQARGQLSMRPLMMWRIAVDKDGQIMSTGEAIKWHKRMIAPAAVAGCTNPPRDSAYMKEMHEELTPYLQCALLTFCFMHCKNVALKVAEPPKPLSRNYQRKHGLPLVRYRLIEIEPMKQVLEREGGASRVGVQQAMHICRGFFSHYGDAYGKGKLFGKYEGQFWHESRVRGSREAGIVLHDYKVKAPKLE